LAVAEELAKSDRADMREMVGYGISAEPQEKLQHLK
jgi:hypothetical protein